MPTTTIDTTKKVAEGKGSVYCPMCTHTVEAVISFSSRGGRVKPGQKCPRCSASLDAGYVFRVDRAA